MPNTRIAKMAAQEQLPNAVDGAAARFKDHLDLKVNEHYRTVHPAKVPPTLSLIYGNDFIRVVKADGGLRRDAVAFVARATGNVYRAATWDRPMPTVIANVLESDTWRSMRMAFDQYNVPELLNQIKKVLLDKGLDETWDELKKCKAPQKVNDAWMSLSKKERRKHAMVIKSDKAARLEQLRIMRLGASGEDFITPKIKALAKRALGQIKKLKATYDEKVNMPSNVGGFIMAVFRRKGNRKATSELNLQFGNNLAVGTGIGLGRELENIAENYKQLNDGEIAGLGIVMLRAVRRRKAADTFARWADKNLNLDDLNPSDNAAAPKSRSKVFDAEVKEANGFAGGFLMQLGTELVEVFCYMLAEGVNWHAINHTGLLGHGDIEDSDYDLVEGLVSKATQRIDYGIELTATLIVALLRRAKMKGQALAVKRFALKDLPDSFEDMG